MSAPTAIRSTLAGRVVAVAAIALLATSLTGCSLINQLTGAVDRDDTGAAVDDNGNADIFTIKVGDCLNDATAADEVTNVPLVTCDKLHDTEVVSSIIIDEDGDYPGEDAVFGRADDECAAAFEEYVGIAPEDSVYAWSYYAPTEGTWGTGDREILCTVYDPAGPIDGTLKGAAA